MHLGTEAKKGGAWLKKKEERGLALRGRVLVLRAAVAVRDHEAVGLRLRAAAVEEGRDIGRDHLGRAAGGAACGSSCGVRRLLERGGSALVFQRFEAFKFWGGV